MEARTELDLDVLSLLELASSRLKGERGRKHGMGGILASCHRHTYHRSAEGFGESMDED